MFQLKSMLPARSPSIPGNHYETTPPQNDVGSLPVWLPLGSCPSDEGREC